MRSLEGFVLPALLTLLLHVALLFLLSGNWQQPPERQIMVPQHVMAKLVKAEQAAPKKPAAPTPPPPKVDEVKKPEPTPKKEETPPPKPPEKTKPAPTPKPPEKTPPEKPKPDPKKAQEEARKKAEAERRKKAENEMALSMKTEEEAQQAETDAELAMSYTDAISAMVAENFSPPPSARHGMEVLLRIQLIPTGEVVGVSVLRSSGNDAFDLAAINAVKKAERFPEVADAPPKVFETRLRSLQLLFRPDLRL